MRAQALLDREVREVLAGWRERLAGAALVFVHAPSANAAPLFGGEAPALARGDPRVRSVPFTTRRPTFAEAKRVAALLLTVRPASLPQPGARIFFFWMFLGPAAGSSSWTLGPLFQASEPQPVRALEGAGHLGCGAVVLLLEGPMSQQ